VDEADVALFNSCTVTAEAEADLRAAVRRAARANPALRSIVMGCAAARDDGAIASLPSVERVIPAAPIERIATAIGIDGRLADRDGAQSGTRALLRIQDGCAEHCTFCATTLARGAHRSRAADAIVADALSLAGHHAEIVLTGTHIGAWGAELGSSLGALVERLVREVPRVRFRLTSLEATEVDDRLRELFVDVDRLAPHLHAPLQSGSDRVLRRMGRHWYTAAGYARAIERIVGGRSVFALGADVMAGFPGETGEDHARTRELIESLPFTYLHVFPFSMRPGTAAERLPERVDGRVAAERARELRALGEARAERYRASRAGGDADVIAIGPDGARDGLTEDYLTVALPGAEPPRGARFRARLERDGARLLARAAAGIFR
jgi:threonylcarbamoyladenosine tRNA methylthiotransferase MtaB